MYSYPWVNTENKLLELGMGQMTEPCLIHGLLFTEGDGSTVEG